jgi:hypothetical protein
VGACCRGLTQKKHIMHPSEIYHYTQMFPFVRWVLECKELQLRNNYLSGKFPDKIENRNLASIDLSRNYLYGRIPDDLCELEPTVRTLGRDLLSRKWSELGLEGNLFEVDDMHAKYSAYRRSIFSRKEVPKHLCCSDF